MNTEKTEQFYENLRNLLESAPKEVSYLVVVMGAGDEKQKHLVSACSASTIEICEMIHQTTKKAPEIIKGLEMALTISKLENNPLDILQNLFNKRRSCF